MFEKGFSQFYLSLSLSFPFFYFPAELLLESLQGTPHSSFFSIHLKEGRCHLWFLAVRYITVYRCSPSHSFLVKISIIILNMQWKKNRSKILLYLRLCTIRIHSYYPTFQKYNFLIYKAWSNHINSYSSFGLQLFWWKLSVSHPFLVRLENQGNLYFYPRLFKIQ